MSIKFLCTHCKKALSVKDELAGKKGKCPHCGKVIAVPVPGKPAAAPVPAAARPAPAAPAPPPPEDLEAAAAAALADEPKAEDAPAPSTIDFECPMCGENLHMALDLAGKREPCPQCRRIIKVPEPAKKDPANWRKVDQSLPSGARREEEKAPEGAWTSAASGARVSREALQDAGAIPEAKALLTVRQRIIRYTWAAGIVVFVAVVAVLGYLKWAENQEARALEAALGYADSDAGKAALGRDGRAAVQRLAGEFYLRKRDAGSAKGADDQFRKCLGTLGTASDGDPERDALLQDLVMADVESAGAQADVDAGLKRPWDAVQRELGAAMRDISSGEARLEALRAVARRLAAKGQGVRAIALASSLYPSPNGEKAEALGAVGLELLAEKKQDLAANAADQALKLYDAEKDRPALAASATALAVALGRQPPEPGKKGNKWEVEDKEKDPIGRAEGLARIDKWDEARATANSAPTPDARLRANVALAAAALDKNAGANDATNALQLAQNAPKPSSWLWLRLVRIGAKAGVAADALRPVADAVPNTSLHGRAQLAVFDAELARTNKAADVKLLDGVDGQTLSARLAHAEWARHNVRYSSGTAGVVKTWDAPDRAFGLLGVALGSQRDE